MSQPPTPKKTDSLGRNRLPSERYSQHGGPLRPKHIVWTCKVCSKAWNIKSKSIRYDAKCRFCETRNTIYLTLPKTYYKGRTRVTQFSYFPDAETAAFEAKRRNLQWMQRKVSAQYRESGFVKATLFNQLQGSIDEHGHHHPKTKEMT